MKQYKHCIFQIEPGSIAEELELKPGDYVLAINDQPIEDIFDYDYLCQDEYLELLVCTKEGEEILFELEKDEDEDLGIVFENGLMDEYRSCRNKCIFCFIDQMPPGMRDTLYFKDDDSRLSFLQGNYVTLTNMSDDDIDRIIRYHLDPINISIHTMNPELRCRMLNNRFAGEALKKLDRLYEAGTSMNGQIVLCAGINDGKELEDTISKLEQYVPTMQSVSVVPVGLTRYRDNLYPLTPITKEIAEKTIDCVEKWQKKFYEKWGIHFIHASDEFYILANRPMPEADRYDGYIQLENGVGMIRLLNDEFMEALDSQTGDRRVRHISLATGLLMAPFLEQLKENLQKKYPGIMIDIYPIKNHFFGENITVSGLITGQDLEAQLREKDLGEYLLLPENMLRSGEEVFLDDRTISWLESTLQVPINIVKSDGAELLAAWTGEGRTGKTAAYTAYEKKE
ncbi:MAG: DUF512 domain-containing protein [Clostridiales bacterium]|nr:DUF512 domain-containing protein [Clostridiales bacterium]